MARRADKPRWHAFVRRTATPALIVVLVIYCVSPHLGFMARSAHGPLLIFRPGAVGVGLLNEKTVIQDIPQTAYLGPYTPTVDMIWTVVFWNNEQGLRFYVPYWLFVLAIVSVMVWVYVAGLTRLRGRCPACGYDLEGCVVDMCDHCGISAVTCPECGAKTARAALRAGAAKPAAG